MIPSFELHRPTTVADAVGLLAELGDGARILAGGTELVLILQEGFAEAEHLVDVKRIPGLREIRVDASGWLVLGATARHDDIASDHLVAERFPALAAVAGLLANRRVRNAGTIGGNLAFAEPHADPPALLVAAGAELRLEHVGGGRTVPLEGWIQGPFEPDLSPGELLSEVRIPLPGSATAFAYERFTALERPSLSVAVRLDAGLDGMIDGGRIVVGCVGGAPQVVDAALDVVRGLEPASVDSALPEVAVIVGRDIEAGSDPHGPEDYKRHLAGVLAGRALRRAGADLSARAARTSR